jgi:type VI protein secretion system component Hcp
MPTDAYVRFGEDTNAGLDDYGQAQPLLDGDCTDAKHFNWCELRDTDFHIEFPHSDEKAGDDPGKSAAKHLPTATLKKRVDWASTRLFLACIQASQASIEKNKENDGVIEQVRVEVCKDVGDDEDEGKLCYLAFEYENVRILDFAVDMSDPEPTETIRFSYEAFRMGYQQTDPETGLPIGSMEWTDTIADTAASGAISSSDGDGNAQAAAGVSSALSAQGASQGSASSSNNGNGNASAGGQLATATDAALGANFPGIWGPAGLGILPD